MSTFSQVSFLLLIHAIKTLTSSESTTTKPNIIFILADDWGINDVGWTNDNTDTQTPFLDNLAKTEGLILTNYYAERVCTASRAAFLTGRYPSRYGLQSGVLFQHIPYSLTRQVSLLSNEFKENGYQTHMIGKWHLGFQAFEYTPTYRGFDTFFGYWAGGETYFTHKSSAHYNDEDDTIVVSSDLHLNDKPAMNNDYDGVYGVWWQRDETINLLKTKVNDADNDNDPFFFYFGLQASHNPREAPDDYNNLYINGRWGDDHNRYTMKAQTTSVDDAMKDIITYIRDNNLWDNSLIIFSSDNGGKYSVGDNAPYRGFKNTSWEGGVKVAAFVTGGYLNDNRKGQIMDYSMHITDWYNTLLSAADLDVNYYRSTKLHTLQIKTDIVDTKWIETDSIELDGINMWKYIQDDIQDTDYFLNEREILLDLNDVWCEHESCGALKIGRYKYIRGNNIASLLPDYDDGDLWYRDFALNIEDAETFCSKNKQQFIDYHNINDIDADSDSMINSIGCQSTDNGCLFDLELDPCEYYDLSVIHPDILLTLQTRLNQLQEEATVALMDENLPDKLLPADDINPHKVCKNIFYWCPFQQYDKVSFENMLYTDINTDDNDDNDNDKYEETTGFVMNTGLYMCLWIGMCLGLFFICKHERNRKNEQFLNQNNNLSLHEFTPLISHRL